ncbi:MAG: hypothetical protein NW220_24390 [Leptolyngbyaceae cyanobacterium bins.349]|nr:hypothetical protein [Leptolyngbyaceae cyanobacterium bins.349]
MAKKKSKHKSTKLKKATHDLNEQIQSNFLDTRTGKAGTALVGALIGEILAVAIQRVLQKVNSGPGDEADSGDRNLVSQIVTTLQANLDPLKAPVQQTVADAISTVKSVAADAPAQVSQVAEAVKDHTSTAIDESTQATKTTASSAVGEIVDTAKSVVGLIGTLNAVQQERKEEKHKHKQKHKEA